MQGRWDIRMETQQRISDTDWNDQYRFLELDPEKWIQTQALCGWGDMFQKLPCLSLFAGPFGKSPRLLFQKQFLSSF